MFLQMITKNLFSQEIIIFFLFGMIKILGLSHDFKYVEKQKSFTTRSYGKLKLNYLGDVGYSKLKHQTFYKIFCKT